MRLRAPKREKKAGRAELNARGWGQHQSRARLRCGFDSRCCRRLQQRQHQQRGGVAAGREDEPFPEGAVEPAEHRVRGGRRQHLRGPLQRLPPLLWQGRALPRGLRPGAAPPAARPPAHAAAAPHRPLPAMGDVPHRAPRRQPLRRHLRSPPQPGAPRARRRRRPLLLQPFRPGPDWRRRRRQRAAPALRYRLASAGALANAPFRCIGIPSLASLEASF